VLEESAALSRRLAVSESGLRPRFREKASTQLEQANLIQRLLLYGTMLSSSDAGAI
jgi:hypothetical protein